jgi:hypothetical protein
MSFISPEAASSVLHCLGESGGRAQAYTVAASEKWRGTIPCKIPDFSCKSSGVGGRGNEVVEIVICNAEVVEVGKEFRVV